MKPLNVVTPREKIEIRFKDIITIKEVVSLENYTGYNRYIVVEDAGTNVEFPVLLLNLDSMKIENGFKNLDDLSGLNGIISVSREYNITIFN